MLVLGWWGNDIPCKNQIQNSERFALNSCALLPIRVLFWNWGKSHTMYHAQANKTSHSVNLLTVNNMLN